MKFPLRPIRSDAEYDRAAAIIDRLALRGEADLDSGESDYLDALSVFVEKYDDDHYPVDTANVSGSDVLQHLVESSAEIAKEGRGSPRRFYALGGIPAGLLK
jgi:HTH-type transcriptional regulator/antitoxin HigA